MGGTMSMKPAINLIVAALFELPGYFAGIYLGVKCRRKPALIVYLLSCSFFTLCFVAGLGLSPSNLVREVNTRLMKIEEKIAEEGGKLISKNHYLFLLGRRREIDQ
jgi:hypothetical protein